ncbi:MAG TPA: NAD(P)H-dependent oxidoreductase subunit E [Chloroflexi bacterium]|nr:NAD(P)H-dependent oxidoreductase subunit E [Chloroflexota bacterium]
MEVDKIDALVDEYGGEHRALTTILQDIQDEHHYLPKEALQRVSERMGLPLIQVYQVAKFYKAFSLEPRGKHLITVCLGTACHVRGGVPIVEQLGRSLDIAPGETTKDRRFTLETVNCLGCCALGPVMVVDGEYHGKMAASRVDRVLKRCIEAKEATANG